MNGSELLREYHQHASENAFSELVRRFADLVYSVAKRRVQQSAVAEEVVQTVFIRLAKKAPNCSSDAQLIAWLHRTTLHVAIDMWRSETRRRNRELHAAAMEPAFSDDSKLWEELAPHLDEALNQLKVLDRQAILLRFFQQKPMREVGHVLGITEDAAKMRVGRAVDRLRECLLAKGVTCTALALGTVLLKRAVEAAPAHVVAGLHSLSELGSRTSGIAGAWSLFTRFMLMSAKTKIISGMLVVGMLGLVLHRTVNRNPAASETAAAAPEPAGLGQPSITRGAVRRAPPPPIAPAGVSTVGGLEDLKTQLRALLQRPPPAKGYPPTPMRDLLAKFGGEMIEAVPILLEALMAPDYETRLWAAGGLKVITADYRETQWQDLSKQAFELSRSALAPILQSEREPDLLRSVVIGVFIPDIIYDGQGTPLTRTGMYSGADEDVITALRAIERRGFRFTIVERLMQYLRIHPEQTEAFRSALEPMLADPKPAQRFLAAYALASWPGDKPEEVKRELLRQLKEASPYSHHAAGALGRLGESASDTVPDLLAYAERTKEWTAGYASSAIESACRLKPELRSQFPEIDQKLQAEVDPVPLNPTSAPLDGDSAQDASSSEGLPVHARPLALVNLTLDARVLLVEQENPNRERIESVLRQFGGPGGIPDTKTAVTPENYANLSKALREIDPKFEADWRDTVHLNYPWLDRLLSAKP